MPRRYGVNFAIFSMVMDMSLTLLALIFAIWLRPWLNDISFIRPLTQVTVSPFIYVIVPILWAGTFLVASVYDPKRIYKTIDELQIVAVATVIAGLLFAGLLYLTYRDFSRWLFVVFVIVDVVLLLGWRFVTRSTFRIGRDLAPERSVLIVGAGEVGQRVGNMIRTYEWMGLSLRGYLDDELEPGPVEPDDVILHVLGRVDEVREVVQDKGINDVVIALPQHAYDQINELVLALHGLPVQVRVVPDYYSLALYRASVENFGGLPMINLRDPALNDVQRLAKRLFDLVIASTLLLVASPFMAIIALLIRFDSPGPVIFRQQRVGENGRLFSMYKFRSMVVGAEQMQDEVLETTADGKVLFKKEDDPRVTRVGRFVRHTSLDELPQLFNVLKGDMSLVGPRPELPWLVGQYEPWQHKRFAVPQGMTGWWQINGRADKPLHLHTEDDIYYVQNYSLWMDIYILLKTPWVVMRGTGAY
jgi:exopolysaccharide biosynthesis polyprenyl glycosylphosphotransferase